MDKKYQVFISSTFGDLKNERRAAIETVIDFGHIPVGMEAFHASNEDQWSYITRTIKDCDYYIVIVAERYGSTAPDGISFTEKEYDFAKQEGIPIITLLLAEEARQSWRSRHADQIDDRAAIERFRQKCKGLLVKFWSNEDQIRSGLATALPQVISKFPRDGWIRSRDALRPEIANQLSRLIQENEQFKVRLEAMKNEPADLSEFIGISGMLNDIKISFELKNIAAISKGQIIAAWPPKNDIDMKDIDSTECLSIISQRKESGLDALHCVGRSLLDFIEISTLKYILVEEATREINSIVIQQIKLKPNDIHVSIEVDGFDLVIQELKINDLIAQQIEKAQFNGRERRQSLFHLTTKGRRFLRWLEREKPTVIPE